VDSRRREAEPGRNLLGGEAATAVDVAIRRGFQAFFSKGEKIPVN
jgi:hypothetical protein